MSQYTQPPTTSDFDLPDQPPAWPKVIGIISIVLASLGLTCGGCGVGVLVFMSQILKMAEQQMGPAPAVMYPGPGLLAISAFGVLWAVVLLIAGIATLKRRPAGRSMHLVYAGVAVVLTIISTVLNFQHQSAIASWAAANPGDKWAQNQSPASAYAGMVFGVALGLGYPVFLLIWFGPMAKRPEAGALDEEPIV